MKPRSFPHAILAALFALSHPAAAGAEAEEVVIHRGEEFTSPGLGPKEEIRFVREFALSAELRKKQPEFHVPSAKPPLTAAKALELARAGVDSSAADGYGEVRVAKLELLHHPAGQANAILFYLVDFTVDGSEVQRLVLMDGTVVKPRLTKVPANAEPRADRPSPR